MRYFTRVIEDPDHKDYMEPRSLHRFADDGSSGERLDNGEWVDDPNLLAFCGIGGDNDYHEITKKEARKLYKKFGGNGKGFKGGEGSGNFGHGGLHGVWGGSGEDDGKDESDSTVEISDSTSTLRSTFDEHADGYKFNIPEGRDLENLDSLTLGKTTAKFRRDVVIPVAEELGIREDWSKIQSILQTYAEHEMNVPYMLNELEKYEETDAYELVRLSNKYIFSQVYGDEPIPVYRGQSGDRKGLVSYSLDRDTAKKFAGKSGKIVRTLIKPDDIVASPGILDLGFWGSSEREVLIDKKGGPGSGNFGHGGLHGVWGGSGEDDGKDEEEYGEKYTVKDHKDYPIHNELVSIIDGEMGPWQVDDMLRELKETHPALWRDVQGSWKSYDRYTTRWVQQADASAKSGIVRLLKNPAVRTLSMYELYSMEYGSPEVEEWPTFADWLRSDETTRYYRFGRVHESGISSLTDRIEVARDAENASPDEKPIVVDLSPKDILGYSLSANGEIYVIGNTLEGEKADKSSRVERFLRKAKEKLGGSKGYPSPHRGLPGVHGGSRPRLSESQNDLLENMKKLGSLMGAKREDHKYRNIYELVMDQGKFFDPPDEPGVPDDIQAGEYKACYENAAKCAGSKYTYVEGYASIEGLPMPIEHAWLVTSDDQVIDPTWTDGRGVAYYGVPMDTGWVNEILAETGTWGILSNFENIRWLLKEGLPNEAIRKGKKSLILPVKVRKKGGPGSGYHGHPGLPGVWGGSRKRDEVASTEEEEPWKTEFIEKMMEDFTESQVEDGIPREYAEDITEKWKTAFQNSPYLQYETSLENARAGMIDADTEQLVISDGDGNPVVFHYVSPYEDRVNLPDAVWDNAEGMVICHNHPQIEGNYTFGFSPQDLHAHIYSNAAEMQVVQRHPLTGDPFLFRMSPGDAGWPEWDKVAEFADYADNSIQNDQQHKIWSCEITIEEAQVMHFQRVFKAIADEFDLNYKVERLDV